MATGSGNYAFREDEQPRVLGAPYMPRISAGLKIAYTINAILLVLFATFTQGLYSTNLPNVAGGYALTNAEAGWLSAVYAGFAASSSLFLIKGRQQFGIMPVATVLLALFVIASTIVWLAPSFPTALIGRAANGLVTSTVTAAAVYYLMVVLPADKRPAALPIILGCLQLGMPLARMVPVEVVIGDGNVGLHLLNIAVPLLQLLLLRAFPLPPSSKDTVFERKDLLMIALLVPAIVLLTAVLALGRAHWWSDTPWLGLMLAFAVPLFAAGIVLEYGRRNPTLSIQWMTQWDVLCFGAIVVMERIAIAEQSVGAAGLFQVAGLNNDQLRGLFGLIMLAELAGIIVVVLTLSEKAVPYQALVALLMIAGGAWIDSFANGLTRPRDMVFSQMLVGMGTTMFIGPALIWIALRMLRTGSQYLVSMIMVFSFTQNIGSLAGSALLNSYQYVQTETHGQVIASEITVGDPQVLDRIRREALAVAPAAADSPAALAAGTSAIGQSAGQQAAILGLLDAFRLIGTVSLLGALVILILLVRRSWTARKDERPA